MAKRPDFLSADDSRPYRLIKRLIDTDVILRRLKERGLNVVTQQISTEGYYDGPRWLQRSAVDELEDQAHEGFRWDNMPEHNGEHSDH